MAKPGPGDMFWVIFTADGPNDFSEWDGVVERQPTCPVFFLESSEAQATDLLFNLKRAHID